MTLDERAEALYKRLNACVDTSRCISLEELKQCEQEEHADVAAIAKELQAVVVACAEVAFAEIDKQGCIFCADEVRDTIRRGMQ